MGIAQGNDVTVLYHDRFTDAASVDKGSVAAVQVGQAIAIAESLQYSVVTRNFRVGDADIVVHLAAQCYPFSQR